MSEEPKPPAKGKVYFVCRSVYESPLGHRIVEFDADSVLDWFQRNWPDDRMRRAILNPEQEGAWVSTDGKGKDIPIHNNDAVWEYIDKLVGGHVYDMLSVWEAMAKWGRKPPETLKEFKKFVSRIEYYGGPIEFSEHGLQVITDDDEVDISWYLFDETYLKNHPERSAFLLKKDWMLPERFADTAKNLTIPDIGKFKDLNPKGDQTKGCTYFLSPSIGHLYDLEGFKISGIRLPELGEFLATEKVPLVKRWGDEMTPLWPESLLLARAFLHSTQTNSLEKMINVVQNNAHLGQLWTTSTYRYPSEKPDYLTGGPEETEKDLVFHAKNLERDPKSYWIYTLQPLLTQTSAHLCQVRFNHKATTTDNKKDWAHDSCGIMIFFDDLWIAENRELAESILRYSIRWDVLFDGKES